MEFRLVWDQPEPCPYLEGQTARLPLRVPSARLSPEELDLQLAAGDRRTGRMMYRPDCPDCRACEPLRVDIAAFKPNKTQRRVWRKNIEALTVTMGRATVDDERLALYNRHKSERGLSRSGEPITRAAYKQWLVDTNCDTFDVCYRLGGRLVGLSVLDLGAEAASSVYHYFDPDEEARSIGVFSALAEMAWLRANGRRWYYLGLYVEACSRLSYKADYRPHERLVGDTWVAG